MVTIVWETWLDSGSELEGLTLTRKIWSDMTSFNGYVSHSLLVDNDDNKHLLVVSKWLAREYADQAVKDYAGSETVELLKPFLARPRSRWVFSEDKAYSA